VVCISKGKAHKRYEFGCKVGIAATNREGLFLTAIAFEGNPYDGHTLNATAAKTEEMTGVAIQRLYADKGYRGHDYDGKAKVMLSGNKRGLTPTMKKELKRRSAIEPMIGHAKNDGRLGRNYLLGTAGDKINAILAAAGHNLRLVLACLERFLARFIGAIVRLMAKGDQISIAGDPGSVFPNIGLRLSGLTTSMA
jgi:IS5 family transposase